MTLTEIVVTLALGAVGGLISFEIWGWLPIVTRVLDEARRKVVLDEDSADASERFNERRVTGVAWSARQLSVARLRQVHAGRSIRHRLLCFISVGRRCPHQLPNGSRTSRVAGSNGRAPWLCDLNQLWGNPRRIAPSSEDLADIKTQ